MRCRYCGLIGSTSIVFYIRLIKGGKIMPAIFKRFIVFSAIFALTATVFSTTAFAESHTVITGTDASLSTISVDSFNNITLDGTTQDTTANINSFTVKDARGTGKGWSVTVSASPFTNGEKILSPNSLEIGAPTVEKLDSGSSEVHTIDTFGGYIDNESPLTMLTAKEHGGMGTFTIKPITMTLTLQPKEVYAGTYTSTITVQLIAGP
jgi:hypothetical protein